MWGFLDKLASKDVSNRRTRANVVKHALARTFDHETATAVDSSLPAERRGFEWLLFTDGQKAAREYMRGDNIFALHELIGLLNLRAPRGRQAAVITPEQVLKARAEAARAAAERAAEEQAAPEPAPPAPEG